MKDEIVVRFADGNCEKERNRVLEIISDTSKNTEFKSVETCAFMFMRGYKKKSGWFYNPPLLTLINDKIVGFCSGTFKKNGYYNCYFAVVDRKFKNKGVGTKLFDYIFGVINPDRFKVNSKTNEGIVFFKNWGVDPIGCCKDYYYFDFCSKGIKNCKELKKNIRLAGGGKAYNKKYPVPLKEFVKYRKKLDTMFISMGFSKLFGDMKRKKDE